MQQVCFRLDPLDPPPAPILPAAGPLDLTSGQADALSELLQVFACGEESAALAFAHLARQDAETATQQALAVISGEEAVHEELLRRLRDALPAPRHDPGLRRTLIRFYGSMNESDPGRHLAGIAALDSGVCIILHALLGRVTPTANEPRARATFSRIQREEAGHVRLSRVLARDLADAAVCRRLAIETRHKLAGILMLRADCFEALAIDADALFAAIREPPRGLFA